MMVNGQIREPSPRFWNKNAKATIHSNVAVTLLHKSDYKTI